ncbi:potassium channel family protein [Butyrivibrio sp.]|jgi:trk system potassium uptake protein TrkA|uniref:potassium channel family protein n=1 Tax=Butyrivibrio sp. TaxID=28121 RepID=UPI0025BAF945|nr:TrkA family potassium uptake protein [Butyrivibrio sp.]
MKKSVAVLGLGRYGISLAKSLYEMGADVLVADKNEDLIKEMADFCTVGICADLENEEEIKSLDIKNMDIVVCAMGRNLSASIMSVAVAKELGVPLVVAKSSSERMSSILKKVGADKIIIPEDFGGLQSARILISDTFIDYFQLDENLSMVEIRPRDSWIGKSLLELDLRKKYKLNVVAVKNSQTKWGFIDPQRKLTSDTTLLVVIETNELNKINKG